MFWAFEDPVVLTFRILATLCLLIILIAPFFKWKRMTAFGVSTSVALFLFIPSCMGIMTLMDRHRFGIFEYSTVQEITQPRFRWLIPAEATKITIDKRYMGFRARYQVDKEDFRAFINTVWENYPHETDDIPQQRGIARMVVDEDIERSFGDLNWAPLQDALFFTSPTAPNGAGAVYFFEPVSGTVYQQTAFW